MIYGRHDVDYAVIGGKDAPPLRRYFRHTWVNAYRSLPGRSVQILVRDAAAPNHPVIGIAALGSSVVQQSVRDQWIGWDARTFIEELTRTPTAEKARWLLSTLDGLIESICSEDLVAEGILQDVSNPTSAAIERLKKEAAESRRRHRRDPNAAAHRQSDWEKITRLSLFRSKRCEALARFLSMRKAFLDAGLVGNETALGKALESKPVRDAAGQLIRSVKADHVGVHMMDVIVCGSVAPYNLILGGKLVSMLMCSPEAAAFYKKRYANQESVIASSMKGSPVVKTPELVLLGTTSLYGTGSSQYNRIRIPASEIGGDRGVIEYRKLGLSEGFGSYHFSKQTMSLIDSLLEKTEGGRKVNFIFGEGVNPRMRQIRDALGDVGLPDVILKHGTRRVVYAVQLAENFREVLLGVDKTPNYLLPLSDSRVSTELICSYWQRRWLSKRIGNEEILTKMSQHALPRHGARVRPGEDDSLC